MYKFSKISIYISVFIFLCHGFLYYYNPDKIYIYNVNQFNSLQYIKYFCIVYSVPFLIFIGVGKGHSPFSLLIVALAMISTFAYVSWLEDGNILIFQFIMGIAGYMYGQFLCENITQKRALSLSIALLTASFLAVLYEKFILQGANFFSRSGFRAIGPFINPNNTGIFCSVITTYILSQTNNRALRLSSIAFCASIVFLTGSKTAIILMIISIYMTSGTKSFSFSFLFLSPIVILSIIYMLEHIDISDLRSFDLQSAYIRFSGASTFFYKLNTADFEGLSFGFSNRSLIDNFYLDLVGFSGIFSAALFIFIQICAIYMAKISKANTALSIHIILDRNAVH